MNDKDVTSPPEVMPKRPSKDGRFLLAIGISTAYGMLVRLAFGLYAPLQSALPHAGGAMLMSFLFLTPFIVGMLMVYVDRANMSWPKAIFSPCIPMMLVLLLSALTAIEGSICILLAAPIFMILSAIGGVLMFAVLKAAVPRARHFCFVLLVPLMLGYGERELPLPNATRVTAASVHINAPPAQIWHLINDAEGIQPDEMAQGLAWRIGVPYPVSALTVASPDGRVRKLRWQKGVHFDEPIVAWQENRLIRWTYRFATDSIPPGALDEHVQVGGKYFDLVDTSYQLDPEQGGTRLSIQVSYRVTTQFNWYAVPLARLLVGDAANTILHFYKRRCEDNPMPESRTVAMTATGAAP
ncbi:SRPBCC family protein [Dyella japonica]|uniref:Polyketide cyclase/dehydrase n=1 Tax=Dyella japonica A8 TaxID=1217721 RepID=A0A075K1W1_9GAMM|nr:SRPBCC family protein [Dyella japonica]AIF47702.1 polyketide cyclase/dehydrase [Dyella japonica A8]